MATNVESATKLLDELIDEMNARYDVLDLQRKQKVFEPSEGRYPSQDTPLIVLVVDELAELTASLDKKDGAEFASRLRLIVAKGRAAGIVPILCTQKPSSDVVPTFLRDLIATRISLRCGTEAQAITVLGDEAVKVRGAAAHLIGGDTPGMAFMTGEEGGEVIRFRSYFLDGQAMEELPARAEQLLGKSAAPQSEATGPADPPPSEIPPIDQVPEHVGAPAPSVVFGCPEHHGMRGALAVAEALICPSCMLMPGGKYVR
jgi:S-DNA-T family DNA segregation ATPase FtsK/SpoIIIE